DSGPGGVPHRGFVRAGGGTDECPAATRFLDVSCSTGRFFNRISANPSFWSGNDFGCSGTRSRVRLWRLPRSYYCSRFLVSRRWRYFAFRNLYRNDFDDSFSHRPIRLPWSGRVAWFPDSWPRVAANTSRRAPSNCDESEVRI